MSLIADALAKSNRPPKRSTPRPPSQKSLWVYRSLLLTALVLLLGVLSYAPTLQIGTVPPPTAQKTEPPPRVAAVKEKPAGVSSFFQTAQRQWSLNGIVRGGPGKSLALINDELVAEGDSIQGAKVVRVEPTQVELQFEDQVQTLVLEE